MDLGAILTQTNEGLMDLGLLIGRVAIGVCFVLHALGKLGVVGPGNMAGFEDWLKDLGVPMAALQARMAMLSEMTGGTLLALGLLTRPACVLLIVTMTVAGMISDNPASKPTASAPR